MSISIRMKSVAHLSLKSTLLLIFLLSDQAMLKAQPCKEVVGYYCNWQWYDRSNLVNPMTIPYSKYTILNYAFLNPQANGSIALFDSWADENLLLGPMNWSTGQRNNTQSLPYCAHLNNVKVLASIGGWTLSNNFPGIASDPVKRANFASHCRQLITVYDFDGIDIDWEYPGYAPHGGTSADKVNYTVLLQQIRDTLNAYGSITGKNYLLTAALPAGPSNMANIQWPQVANILDFLNIMTYDFFGIWDNNANHNSPLFAPQQGDPSLNCNAAIQAVINFGVPRSKITMGLPFYGRSAKSNSAPALFGSINHTADDVTFPEDEGMPLYYNILPRLSLFNRYWDSQAQVPYLIGKNSLYTFVSYDDTNSIALKAQYINDQNLRGAIVWEITGDVLETVPGSGIIGSTPLATVLNTTLCGGTVNTCLPPAGVSASGVTAGSAQIAWTFQTGNTYSVMWKRSVDNTWNSTVTGSSPYTITNLSACTSYNYKVMITCSNGSTAENTVQNFTTTGCCTIPGGLTASSISSSGASLGWTSTGASTYNLQYKISSASTWTSVSVTGTTYTLTGLTSCTNYIFQVQSVCGASTSTFSPSHSFQTTGCNTSCPVPITGTAGSITNSGATLSWGSTGVASYSIQYRIDGSTTWTTVTSTTNSRSLTSLISCRNYEWRVASVCAGIPLVYSNTAYFSTSGCTNSCNSIPQPLTVTPTSTSSVSINWSSTGAAKYRVQYKLQNATTWTSKTVSGTTLSITRLTSCSNYIWRVRSECTTSNTSLYSSIMPFTTTGCTVACATPTGLAATQMGTVQAQIGWNATTAGSYNYRYRKIGASAYLTGTSLVNSVSFSSLDSCSSYEFNVQGACSGVISSWSSTLNFSTTGSCSTSTCNAPGAPSVTPSTTSAVVTWITTGATSYTIYHKSISASTWTTIGGITTGSYTLSGLNSCTSYQVKVQGNCSGSSSTIGPESSFSTSGCSTGGPAPNNYCSSYSLNASNEFIQSFRLSNLNNNSGNNNGFGNFINMVANLMVGRTDTLRFAPGFVGITTYPEYWTVLIDFNRNGSFSDPGETVAQTISNGTAQQMVVFTTPATASIGGARLRIQMKRGSYAGICEVYSNGEVEDYLVEIATSGNRVAAEYSDLSVDIFPNPASEAIQIKFHTTESNKFIRILNLSGQEIGNWHTDQAQLSLPLEDWKEGIYILQYTIDGRIGNFLFVKN